MAKVYSNSWFLFYYYYYSLLKLVEVGKPLFVGDNYQRHVNKFCFQIIASFCIDLFHVPNKF